MNEEEFRKIAKEYAEMYFTKGVDSTKIFKYVNELEKKVEQLENIRKKAIEYVLKNKLYKFKYDDEELFEITTDKKAKDDLLNILNKGE